jgi:hypothetical protein
MIFRNLQRYPHLLENLYQLTIRILRPFRGWFKPGSRTENLLIRLEKISKGLIFDCRMCGHCVLHSTGMTCPMTCPKNLRNGPCGGVLMNGNCEVYPERPCIWVQAWERSNKMPVFGKEIIHIQPPLNHGLEGSSSWVNDLHLKQKMIPRGWD